MGYSGGVLEDVLGNAAVLFVERSTLSRRSQSQRIRNSTIGLISNFRTDRPKIRVGNVPL